MLILNLPAGGCEQFIIQQPFTEPSKCVINVERKEAYNCPACILKMRDYYYDNSGNMWLKLLLFFFIIQKLFHCFGNKVLFT